MMCAGFIIAGAGLASISFLPPAAPLALILAILVGSRVGTALVESTTAGHFFRRVSRRDISSMSVFRGVWPLAYVVAPAVASGILLFGGYQVFFLLTGGFVALVGGVTSLLIKDFR